MSNWKKEVIEVAEKLGWSVSNKGDYFCFSNGSPEGQDVEEEFNCEELGTLQEDLKQRAENFDVSYETYLWLDSSGHGTNGAPYDMKDLYEDMEWVSDTIQELADAISEIEEDE